MIRKDATEASFEKQIWDAACILRGNIDATEYKQVVLGLIFLKYVSDRFEGWCFEAPGRNDSQVGSERLDHLFFVPECAQWKVIARASGTVQIGEVIDNAMRALEKENEQLRDTLPKNFSRPELDKRRLGRVVDLFSNARFWEQGESTDILGRAYEYCLARFAEQEGKLAGEFYTPACVVRTLVEVLKPYSGLVYDPCCGSGGMFVQSVKFIQQHRGGLQGMSIFGQDSNPNTRKMCVMNLAIRGIKANLGKPGADTFFDDCHPDLKADYILANPPFNLSDWGAEKLADDPRWRYGIPPVGNANFAWLQHMIYHLAPEGKLGVVLANGSLSSQRGGEGEIRRRIVEDDLVEGIVAMPSQLFYTTQIPVSLWFLNKNKTQKGKTLFVDASRMGSLIARGSRIMDDDDIAKIASAFHDFNEGEIKQEKGFCAVASREDIRNRNFILTPGRYVEAEPQEEEEPFDKKMACLTEELSSLFKHSRELEEQIRKGMGTFGFEIK